MFRNNIGSFPFSFLLVMALFIISPMACVDLDFDQPPAGGIDPNIPVTTTIAELKSRHVFGEFEEITDDVVLGALVISDDATGNFFKQLIIEDATGGIEIRVEMSDIHNLYPVGRKVYVKAKGLWLGDYNGITQLGAGFDSKGILRIPESLLGQYVIPATYGNAVIPTTKTIAELTIADVSTLVRFENLQFIFPHVGVKYYIADFFGNLNLEDCSRDRIILRSSDFATFATDLTPSGSGSVVGVLGIFNGDYQLAIRDLNDLSLTGERCTIVVDESFDAIGSNDNVDLPDWSNIAVKGSRLWQGKIFQTNHYAQATSFGDSAPEMESWLITPPISTTVPKKITFETAKAFYVHDGLSIWISSNFNGSDVTGATWTQLFPTIANSGSPDNTFIPSGDIVLTGLSGPVRIGFKYVGSGPGGQTTTFRVDNVKVTNL